MRAAAALLKFHRKWDITALYRYFELEIEHPAVPNLTAWYERLQLRAPYRYHVMIPFDDLGGRLQY